MATIQVLLVDDEKEYVESLSERLSLDGYETKVAFSGKEGLEAIGDAPPDVLILDLEMPGIGGMEVLERVRKEHPQTQVVILTGHGGKKVEEKAAEKGAFAFLNKPAGYSDLKGAVNEAWAFTKRITKAVADDLFLSFLGGIPNNDTGALERPIQGPGKRPGKGLRVLLVDDNEEYVTILSERLKHRDLASDTALSGEDAVSLLEGDTPDVMVLDLTMPGMGGMEVLKRVKRDHPGIEVIILTGHGTPADEAEAIRLGAAHYLEKPADLRTLVAAMREAAEKQDS